MDWTLPPSLTETVVGLDAMHLLALAAGLGWASGLRLYAVVFLTGLAGWFDWITLPPGLQVLQHPGVQVIAGTLVLVEFFADKVPWVDSAWDALHTFIRIPAGAALAAGVFGADAGAWTFMAALMGGGLAATAHAAKATTRAAANTSPEPFSNICLSLIDDAAVPVMLWLSWSHPVIFFAVLAIALVVMAAVIVLMFKFLRGLWSALRQHFGARPVARA
ncbi:MAG TPA: DUF4126 domain-containing protein [Ideonella sp.]|uniref:DUF4126 domain-containing protein n=1 Tax=Ideonella sp. TaxID=1929293 RepID=UPI002E351B7C|nr:DUF4126 domain-containing protein [Ideonella sp.]HEX5686050.1 DUF4126 domain-containing protein [Ideonella sp.]